MTSVPQHGDEAFADRAKSLAALIRKVWREIAKSFGTQLVNQGSVTLSDAKTVQHQWASTKLIPVLGHVGTTYILGAEVISQVAPDGHDVLIGDDLVDDYLTHARNRLVGIGTDVWKDVRAQIKLGVDAGESVQEIAARVKNVAQISTARALTIARTETHTAYEAGAYAQASFVGGATKTWLATNDGKTRPSHKQADGQSVPVDQPFTVGASALRFPGDPLGGPHETINCRCSVMYDFADVPALTPTPLPQELELVAAGKWNPTAHPRGKDGKFIKKGGLTDLLSTKKPLLQDVVNAVNDLTVEKWTNLTGEQKDYVLDSVNKLPPQLKETAKADLAKNITEIGTDSPEPKPPKAAPKITQVAPNLTSRLQAAKHGDIIATGTQNGKKFCITAVKDGFNVSDWNPHGNMRLEFLKKDGSVSSTPKPVLSDEYGIKSKLIYGKAATAQWDLTPGETHYAIQAVLDNADVENLGGAGLFAKTSMLTAAWRAIIEEGHWDHLTQEQKQKLLDVTFKDDNISSIISKYTPAIKEYQAKFVAESASSSVVTPKATGSDKFPKQKLDAIDLSKYEEDAVIAHSTVTGDYVEKNSATTIVLYDADGNEINSTFLGGDYDPTIGQFIEANSSTDGWTISPSPTTSLKNVAAQHVTSPSALPVVSPSTQTKIPDGLKGNPGDPAKVTTGVIWGKHAAGTTVLENPDGSEFVRWNGKKYEHVVGGTVQSSWTKKDAYANLKADTHWVVPGGSGQTTVETKPSLDIPKWEQELLDATTDDYVHTAPVGAGDLDLTPFDFSKTKVGEVVIDSSTNGDYVEKTADDTYTLFDADGAVIGDVSESELYKTISDNDVGDTWSVHAPLKSGASLPQTTAPTTAPSSISDQSDAKAFLLAEATNNSLTPAEAMTLVEILTHDDAKNLSSGQWDVIDEAIFQAKSKSLFGASQAHAKWLELPTPNSSAGAGESTPGTPFDINSLLDMDYALGTAVVAINDKNTLRIITEATMGTISVEEWDAAGQKWDTVSSFDPDLTDNVTNAFNEWVLNYSDVTWLTAPKHADIFTPGNSSPAAPDAQSLAYSDEQVITNWPGVFTGTYSTDDVVALSTDGKFQLTKTADGWKITTVDTQSIIALYNAELGAPSPLVLNQLSPTWVVPTKKSVKPHESTGGTLGSKTLFTYAVNVADNGEVLAYGTISFMPHVEYRLVAVAQDDQKSVQLQFRNKQAGSDQWAIIETYPNYDVFTQEWPTEPFSWSPPSEIEIVAVDAPAKKASPLSADPAPVSSPLPPTPASAPMPAAQNPVPSYMVKHFKNVLKSQGKVGYWSKPEKIWDAIKQIQKENPDPANPGYSKYTPLQILQVLDNSLSTQTPSPYETKMTQWAAAYKGQAYIGTSVGGLTSPTKISDIPKIDLKNPAPQIKNAPQETYMAVKKGEYPAGTVLYTGIPDDSTILMRMVVTETGNEVALQSKGDDGQWYHVITPTNPSHFNVHVVNNNMKPGSGQAKKQTLGLDLGTSDISHLTEQQKQSLYDEFKKQPSTYLDSPSKNIYAALKTIGDTQGYSVLQMLRVIDDVGAKKVNKPDEHLFEKKILEWLNSPQGAAIASGQPLPKPPRPKFKAGVDPDVLLPPYEAGNVYSYNVLPVAAATSWFQKVKNKYGEWTNAESSGLKTYTGGSYMSINPYLWGDLDAISDTHAKAITGAQAGMRPSLEPVLLHRGSGYAGVGGAKSHADIEKMVGQTWKSDGFVSTSVGGQAAFGGPVLIEIEAPPGTPMAYLKSISYYSHENEMLLAAGLSYRIVSVKKSGGKSVVRMRVVPDPTASTGGAA